MPSHQVYDAVLGGLPLRFSLLGRLSHVERSANIDRRRLDCLVVGKMNPGESEPSGLTIRCRINGHLLDDLISRLPERNRLRIQAFVSHK